MGEKDCQTCKTWQDCAGKDWYAHHDIRFCPYQVIWILEFAGELRAGRWPKENKDSGYTDAPIDKRQVKIEARFVKPATIIAEVSYRLNRTGIAGKLLAAQIKAGERMESLEPEAYEALMYVKGWRRKRMGFGAWKKWKKLYQKVN